MKCYDCGFWDSDREGCTCPSYEMWYACPIESAKPENQKELEDYAEWAMKQKNSEKVIGTDVCSYTDKVCIGNDCRICDINNQTATKQEE